MLVGGELLMAIALGFGPAPEAPAAPPPVSADAPPPVQAPSGPTTAPPAASAPAASPSAPATPEVAGPAPVQATPAEPAATPTPPPVVAAPPPALPDLAMTRAAHLEDYQARYARRRNALLGTSGGMLAVSLGLYLGTALAVRQVRIDCDDNESPDSGDSDRCVRLVDGSAALLVGAMLFSAGSIVTSGLGGSMAGKSAAARDVLARQPTQPKRVAKGLGIGLLAAGGVALIATNLSLAGGSLNRCNDESRCLARAINYHIAGLAGATVLATVGAGLTGYSVSYERAHRAWTRPGFAFSRSGGTFTLSGRF